MPKKAEKQQVSKADYKAAIPELRVQLVNAQYQLKDADFSVIVLLAGRDRAGCEQVIDRLHEWMDARYLDTWFGGRPTPEQKERPQYWRFWRAMPPNGRIGIYAGGWIINAIARRVRQKITEEEYKRRIRYFNDFDRMLTDDGKLLLKIWLDLPRKEMGVLPSGFPGDPLRGSVRGRSVAIQGGCDLQCRASAPGAAMVEVCRIVCDDLVFEHPDVYGDTGVSQGLHSPACDSVIGIDCSDPHLGDSRLEDGFGAWRCAARV